MPKKIRNGDEFQQRGQKNSANSLQMCLWAVWGNTVLPSLERKRRKFNELRAKNSSTAQYSWLWLSGYREEKGGNPGTHTVVSTLWKNCWYAESHECTFVMLKAKTQSLLLLFLRASITVLYCKQILHSWMNETARGRLWRQNRKHTKREAAYVADVAVIHFGRISVYIRICYPLLFTF